MSAKKWGAILGAILAAGFGFFIAFTHPDHGSSSLGSSAAVFGAVLLMLSAAVSARSRRSHEESER